MKKEMKRDGTFKEQPLLPCRPTEGVISSGTLRDEDLGPTFLGVLESLSPSEAVDYKKKWPKVVRRSFRKGKDPEETGWAMEDLQDRLTELAAGEGLSFGASEGDGACFGFWQVDEEHGDPIREEVAKKVQKINSNPMERDREYEEAKKDSPLQSFLQTFSKASEEAIRGASPAPTPSQAPKPQGNAPCDPQTGKGPGFVVQGTHGDHLLRIQGRIGAILMTVGEMEKEGPVPLSPIYLALNSDMETYETVLGAGDRLGLWKRTSQTVELTQKGREIVAEINKKLKGGK